MSRESAKMRAPCAPGTCPTTSLMKFCLAATFSHEYTLMRPFSLSSFSMKHSPQIKLGV